MACDCDSDVLGMRLHLHHDVLFVERRRELLAERQEEQEAPANRQSRRQRIDGPVFESRRQHRSIKPAHGTRTSQFCCSRTGAVIAIAIIAGTNVSDRTNAAARR